VGGNFWLLSHASPAYGCPRAAAASSVTLGSHERQPARLATAAARQTWPTKNQATMHRRTPSDDEMLSGGGLHARHPSWSGLPADYGVDLEEACCRNRARSHSHDVSHDPRLRRRRQVAALALALFGFAGLTATRMDRRPEPLRRRLRREDDVRNPFADDRQTDDAPAEEEPPTGYEALLHQDFGPDHNATGSPKPRSKAQRQRDERKRAAAEKRRLLEITEAFEQRRKDRLEQRTRAKQEKAARFGREVVHSGTSV